MPLVRVEVRNEYGLGALEMYKDADKDDPKALLEGLAVAGLVGILRQLGDLAEFAAEVFHGLQEQVAITSSRSHKLLGRVKRIEAALPPVEKLVLAQRSHLHYAYTTGLNWRASLRNEQSHFIYSDLPRFMMDPYDQCRGAPNLNLLDKFDPGGPGSCLKRYSDPSLLKRTATGSGAARKKSRKIKKKRSWLQIGEVSCGVSNYSGRTQFALLNMGEQTSPCPIVSSYDIKKLDLGDQSISFDSRNGSFDFEHVSPPRCSMQNEEKGSIDSCSSQSRMRNNDSCDFASIDNKDAVQSYDSPSSISGERMGPESNQVTWDEKMEMPAASKKYDHDEKLDALSINASVENDERGRGVSPICDKSMEAFSSNLDLETDGRRMDHLHTSGVYHQGGSLETLSTNVNMEKPGGIMEFETAGQMDILLENEKQSTQVHDDLHHYDLDSGAVVERNTHLGDENDLLSNSRDLQHDEVESETDHFVDALNAIESEYESDVDFQTKQEVEQHCTVDKKESGDNEDRLTTSHSGIPSSNSEIPVHASSSSNVVTSGVHPDLILPEVCSAVTTLPDKVTSTGIAISVLFESRVSFDPQYPDEARSSSILADVNLLKTDIIGSPNAEPVSNVSFLGLDTIVVPGNDLDTNFPTVLPKPPTEPSTASSTKLWTNGGLLGLEPSKPPDFRVANLDSKVPVKSKQETFTSLFPEFNIRDKSASSIQEDAISECSTSYQDDRKGGILTRKAKWRTLSSDLGVNLLKLGDSYLQSYSHNSRKDSSSQSGAVQPVSLDIESSRSSLEKTNSSRMLELGNRLLQNGFYQKPALMKDENSLLASSVNEYGFQQSSGDNVGHQTFSATGRETLGSVSPLTSPASSPPLGHMRISFQPMNGSEAPKLQLKFPDGNINHDSGRDLFTSFQLVPDTSIQFRDVGSDSDDNTFCLSSPYGSDCLSHQSDSNSEQWESNESPLNKDTELYDALCRISLTESVSTSSETGGAVQGETSSRYTAHSPPPIDGVEHYHFSHLYDDLPSLDKIHPSLKGEVRNGCVPELRYQKAFTTSPLPLPQSHRQAVKQQVELPENRQAFVPENLGHVFDTKLESSVTHQPKPAPTNEVEISDAALIVKSKPQDLRKFTLERKVNQAANGNMEEKGDFLQQIRAKSFNLRRTTTSKPTITTGTTPSAQVKTILEKANAIRQAVGSDWEDDNWSDT